MSLLFEWDSAKAVTNRSKHGVSFDDACSVFQDNLSITIPDTLHSDDEERFVVIGHSSTGLLLVVVHTFRKSRIRIISARKATKKERHQYETNEERSGHAGRI